MVEPYLHHYPGSPFSEKVRLMLGLKELAWRSVIAPAVNPKPDLAALTGGYRRVPVLQTGDADFSLSVLIPESELRRTVSALHARFGLATKGA